MVCQVQCSLSNAVWIAQCIISCPVQHWQQCRMEKVQYEQLCSIDCPVQYWLSSTAWTTVQNGKSAVWTTVQYKLSRAVWAVHCSVVSLERTKLGHCQSDVCVSVSKATVENCFNRLGEASLSAKMGLVLKWTIDSRPVFLVCFALQPVYLSIWFYNSEWGPLFIYMYLTTEGNGRLAVWIAGAKFGGRGLGGCCIHYRNAS